MVDVAGVGYYLHIPLPTRNQLPPVGNPVSLHVHTHLREDSIDLFGFHTAAERALFRQLLGVAGVGPRLALAILSTFSPDRFREHLARQDWEALQKIPGVGRKTAQRLVVELRERLGTRPAASATGARPGPGGDGAPSKGTPGLSSAEEDALAALLALGFTRSEAEQGLEAAIRELARAVAPAAVPGEARPPAGEARPPVTADLLLQQALRLLGREYR